MIALKGKMLQNKFASLHGTTEQSSGSRRENPTTALHPCGERSVSESAELSATVAYTEYVFFFSYLGYRSSGMAWPGPDQAGWPGAVGKY